MFSETGCFSSKNAAFQYQYCQENKEHPEELLTFCCGDFHSVNTDQDSLYIHAGISKLENQSQALIIFSTDHSGAILESVKYSPPSQVLLDANLISFFSAETSLYLVVGLISTNTEYDYNIIFIPISPRDLSSTGEGIVSFQNKLIFVSNFCVYKNQFFISGQYNSINGNKSYGLISNFYADEKGLIKVNKVSILQIPNNAKTGLFNANITSIIPLAEDTKNIDENIQSNEIPVLFSSQNGYVGTLLTNNSTENCCTVPSYTPKFKNSMFTCKEDLFLVNQPDDSYDPDLIIVKPNGKTLHVQFFNQYPTLNYSFRSASSDLYSATKGLTGFGFKNNTLTLITKSGPSCKDIKGWSVLNPDLKKPVSVKVKNRRIYIQSISNSKLDFLCNSLNMNKWTSNLERIPENSIPDKEKTHLYLSDQEKNILDCKIIHREVSFVKPLFVSDMTGSFFNKTNNLEMLFSENNSIYCNTPLN